MNQLGKLDWWLCHWPSVIRDVKVTDVGERYAFEAILVHLLAQDPDAVKRLAQMGDDYDRWLENPLSDFYSTPIESLLRSAITLTRQNSFDAGLIRILRTTFRGLKKFEGDTDGHDTKPLAAVAASGFIHRQGDIAAHRCLVTSSRLDKEIKYLLKSIFNPGAWQEACLHAKPCTGPGSVEEHLGPIDKWNVILREEKLRSSTPDLSGIDPLLNTSELHEAACLCGQEASITHNRKARLWAVPKDHWKMRLITVEPVHLGFLQQYLRAAMLECLKRSDCSRHLVENHYGDQQEVHRHLTLAGSSGSGCKKTAPSAWATLDFSDASDLVSLGQICYYFPEYVVRALLRARSSKFVDCLSGDRKEYFTLSYAGMGNATTFTVETCMFWAVTEAVRRILQLPGKVYVFGDDIIVTTELINHSSEMLVDAYRDLGWKLNASKSFFALGGLFRESCGIQAFNGHDVTYYRFDGFKQDASMPIAVAEKLYETHMALPQLASAILLESGVRNYTGAPLGAAAVDIDTLPRTTNDPIRFNGELQKREFLSLTGAPLKRRRRADGRSLLLAWLLGHTYPSLRQRKRRRGGRKVPPCRMETLPKRLSLERRWLPELEYGLTEEATRSWLEASYRWDHIPTNGVSYKSCASCPYLVAFTTRAG